MMNYRLNNQPVPYIECIPDGELIRGEAEALELVGACGEYRNTRLMIHSASLPEDFFHLRSGLAGKVLLKFSIYQIAVAAVVTPEQANTGRFADLVLETNRGKEFRVFYDRADAEKWLASIDAPAW